jgi:hypothetical protein
VLRLIGARGLARLAKAAALHAFHSDTTSRATSTTVPRARLRTTSGT